MTANSAQPPTSGLGDTKQANLHDELMVVGLCVIVGRVFAFVNLRNLIEG